MEPLMEAVPNFSEGRDTSVIDFIAGSASDHPGAYLLDRTSDPDHHRSVLTIAGSPEAVLAATVEMVGRASRRIDLRAHRGAHPRMGACDVLPFVPIREIALTECAALAHRAGEEIFRRFGVPIYFYEAAARVPTRVRLEDVRRGGFESPSGPPDIGSTLHPTAGATIVGARKFLIAYNINLASRDVEAAKEIARKIRASSGGLPFVKALGLYLETRKQAQISMNLTDFDVTSIDAVWKAVSVESVARGIDIASSELIGLIPRRALPKVDVRWENFTPDKILENRLDAAIHSK
jgi:glutamate formiminotransferase